MIFPFRFQVQPEAPPQHTFQMTSHDPLFKCPKCKNFEMVLRTKKDNNGFFLTCLGKPGCDHVIWLADIIKEIKPADTRCPPCSGSSKNVLIRFKSPNYLGLLLSDRINDDGSYASCLVCDSNLRNVLDIRDTNTRQSHSTGNHTSQANRSNEWARPTYPAPSNRNQSSSNTNNRAPLSNRTPNNSFGSNSSHTNASNTNNSFGGDENVKCPQCNQPATK